MPLRSNELRTNRYGSLLIEYDLAPLVAQSSAHTRTQGLMFLLITSIAAILLLSLARYFILRPVAALDAAMRTIGQGKSTNRCALDGHRRAVSAGPIPATHGPSAARQPSGTEHERGTVSPTGRCHPGGDLFFHEQGTILDVNSRAEQLLGRPAQQLIGADIFTLVSPEYRPLIRQRATAGATGRVGCEFSVWWMAPPIPCEVAAMQREVDGAPCARVVARDIAPAPAGRGQNPAAGPL